MKYKDYTILIKKENGHFIALCLELNVAAQGVSLVEVRKEMEKAIGGYLQFQQDTDISSADLDLETLREFLAEQEESRKEQGFSLSENFSMRIPAPYEASVAL